MQKRLILIFQFVTLFSSIAIVLVFALMALRGLRPEWKTYQQEYFRKTKLGEANGRKDGEHNAPQIHQLHLDDLKRIDRCMTCHAGVENLRMQNHPIPFRTHSDDILEQHPPDKFGCTICHGGQGQAIDKHNAHAVNKNIPWSRPLLETKYLQSSCGQCHLAIYSPSSDLEGTDTFQNGQRIFTREGCLGCHKARGFGGAKGPDLSEQGGKTRHEYNFRHVLGEKTVPNWLYTHFKDPDMVSPGSEMLAVDLAREDMDALVTFTMGLNKPDIPVDYFAVETLKELKGHRQTLAGADIYSMLCSSCHGKDGKGKSYTEYKWGVPGLSNQDFLSVASVDFIEMTLYNGRSGRRMASWTPNFSGAQKRELAAVVDFIKSRQAINSSFEHVKSSKGDKSQGKALYDQQCSFCHGELGGGMQIITLSNQDFLQAASDEFLYKTIANGRRNTAMPGWGKFSSQKVADLISFLRAQQSKSPNRSSIINITGDSAVGESLYHYRCSRCHGLFGEGNSGPAIANADFLNAASDDYVRAIISNGRRHTAMFGWTSDLTTTERLAQNQIADIISYLRFRAANPPDVLYPGPNLGKADTGEILFSRHCSECHGNHGEGTKAPALNNQEFLNSATNGYMLATMTLGRDSTAMPSWGRGSETNPALTIQDRLDITTAIRRWQSVVIKRLRISPSKADIVQK